MFDMVDASGSYYEDDSNGFAVEEEVEQSPLTTDEDLPQEPIQEEVQEQEEIEIDPFDRDYYKPDTFNSTEEELEWYRDRMDTLQQILDSDSEVYKLYAAEQAQAMLEKTALELEGFKEMYQALQVDARQFFLQYIPEALAEHGINPVMSTDEIMQRVDNDLRKEFGEDYRIRLNQAELFDPMSLTAKVWARQQGLVREWDTINARNKELLANWNQTIAQKQPDTPQPVGPSPEMLDNAYKDVFAPKGYTEEQFQYLIQEASSRQLGFEDIEKLIRFDDYIQEAYALGRESALQNRYQEARKEGQEFRVQKPQPVAPQPANSIHEEFLQAFQTGGLPYY